MALYTSEYRPNGASIGATQSFIYQTRVKSIRELGYEVPLTQTHIAYFNSAGGTTSLTGSKSYSFNSWNTQSTGTGTTYMPYDNLVSNVILYAIWDSQSEQFTMPEPLGVKTGYIFSNWGASNLNPGYTYTPNYEVPSSYYTAVYNPITYQVRFNPNGASGTMANQTLTYDAKQTLSDNTFTKQGCTLAGWATSPEGDIIFNDKEYRVFNLTSTQGEIVDLYAIWSVSNTKVTKFGNSLVNNFEINDKQVQSIYMGNNLLWQYDNFSGINLNRFSLPDKIKEIKTVKNKTLSITANDVSGKATTTTINYILTLNMGNGQVVKQVGTATSDPFPQNPSTTESITRTVTFTTFGLSATTTFIQGPWKDSEYTITLSGIGSYGFAKDSSISLPGDGVYRSLNNGCHSTQAVARIDFTGYNEFIVWINSYAESNWDYTIASDLDASSYPTSSTSSTMSTYGFQKDPRNGLTTDYWRKVTYTTDGGSHYIYIVYRKDGSASSYDDKGSFVVDASMA